MISGFSVHEFHVSKLTINHNTKNEMLEITFETFIDDLEAVLPSTSKQLGLEEVTSAILDLTTSTEYKAADSMIAQYLKEKIKITTPEGTVLKLDYLGKEAANDPYGLYIYLSTSMENVDFLALSIYSDFMCELYDDQQNIVIWKQNKEMVDTDLLTCFSRKSALKE